MDFEHEKRLTACEERSKSNSHRLDRLEPIVEEIHNMSEAMVEMATELKHTNKAIEKLDEKVDKIEQEPANKWKESVKIVINAILGAFGAALAAGIIWIIARFG